MTDEPTIIAVETPCPDCGAPFFARGWARGKYHWHRGKKCTGPGPDRVRYVVPRDLDVLDVEPMNVARGTGPLPSGFFDAGTYALVPLPDERTHE